MFETFCAVWMDRPLVLWGVEVIELQQPDSNSGFHLITPLENVLKKNAQRKKFSFGCTKSPQKILHKKVLKTVFLLRDMYLLKFG